MRLTEYLSSKKNLKMRLRRSRTTRSLSTSSHSR